MLDTLGLQHGQDRLSRGKEPGEAAGPQVASMRVSGEIISEHIVNQTEDRTRSLIIILILFTPLLVTLSTVGEGRDGVAVELEQLGNMDEEHQHRNQCQIHWRIFSKNLSCETHSTYRPPKI